MTGDAPLTLPQRRHMMALLAGPLRGRTSLVLPVNGAMHDRSGVVGVLDRLVQRGLAELEPDSWDGSTFGYQITQAGREHVRSELL